jgi:hypothetical protein
MRFILLFFLLFLFWPAITSILAGKLMAEGTFKYKLIWEETAYELEYKGNDVILPTTNRHFILRNHSRSILLVSV